MVLRRKCHRRPTGKSPAACPNRGCASIRQIVAGGGELRIEAADFKQSGLGEDHVASCQMLCHIVGGEDMTRCSRRSSTRCLDPSFLVRRVVGPAASVEVLLRKRANHQRKPMRVDYAVRIGVSDEVAAGRMKADITGDAEALVGLADEAELGKIHRDFGGAIARAVIYDDDLEVGIVELPQRFEAWKHRALGVVSANNDRNHWGFRQRRRTGAIEGDERHQLGGLHEDGAGEIGRRRSRNGRREFLRLQSRTPSPPPRPAPARFG